MNNESLGQCSIIEYFLCDADDVILDYCVLDPDLNLSDHLPVALRCKCFSQPIMPATEVLQGSIVKQLRWDHADLLFYYNTTMHLFICCTPCTMSCLNLKMFYRQPVTLNASNL